MFSALRYPELPSIYCRSFKYSFNIQSQRFASLYAVGEGWTGVFGNGRLDGIVPGHFDDLTGNLNQATAIKIFEGEIKSCSLGWGHTALITTGNNSSNGRNHLFLAGRPHEFSSLLRLYRLPKILRDYAVRHTYKATTDHEYNGNALNPVETLGAIVNWLSDTLTPEVQDWDYARRLSSIPSFVNIEVNLEQFPSTSTGSQQQSFDDIVNDNISEVYCSAGFTVIRTNLGSLYAFGLNGLGQCGIGYTSNNVWKPTRVVGLCLSSDTGNVDDLETDQMFPIVSVALGLQRKSTDRYRIALTNRLCVHTNPNI
jgi:Regulator of chromosome condensation (RCC1) repeat